MRLPTQVLVSAAHAPHPPTSELKGYEVKEHENSAHLLEHHFNVVALLDGDMILLHALVTLDITRELGILLPRASVADLTSSPPHFSM